MRCFVFRQDEELHEGTQLPLSWMDEASTFYPYTDHNYFVLSANVMASYQPPPAHNFSRSGEPRRSQRKFKPSARLRAKYKHPSTSSMYSGVHDVIGNDNEMVLDDALLDEVVNDPLVQKIMDTMEPGAPSTSQYLPQARPPPNSLPLTYGPGPTPPMTPSRGQAASSLASASLTPTKQNVIDMLISKIELSDDQLNKLIEEQKQDANSSLDDILPPAAPQAPAVSSADMESDLDMLTLEQLRSAQVTSITRISSQPSSASTSSGVVVNHNGAKSTGAPLHLFTHVLIFYELRLTAVYSSISLEISGRSEFLHEFRSCDSFVETPSRIWPEFRRRNDIGPRVD